MRGAHLVLLLTLRLAVHRWRQSLGLALAGAAVGIPVVGLAIIHQSGVQAIEESVRAEFGAAGAWKVQGTRAAATVIATSADVTAVRVEDAAVSTTTARVDAPVWALDNGTARVGLLLHGRHAEANGEATVSRHIADTLDVGVGSAITLHPGDDDVDPYRVVGITTDPADRDGDLVIGVGGRVAQAGQPAYWISANPSPDWEHTPGIRASGPGEATQARLDHPPGGLVALARAIPVIAFLTAVLLLTVVAVQLPASRRDVDALGAAGMEPARGWRIVAVWAAVLASAGAAAGAIVAAALLSALRDPVSGALGQQWTGIAVPVTPVALVIALPLMLSTVPVRRLQAGFALLRCADWPVRGAGRAAPVGATILAAAGLVSLSGGLLGASGRTTVDHPELLGLLGLLAVVLAVPLGTHGVLGVGLGPASRRLARRLAGQLLVGTSMALLLGTACAAYSAWHTHNSYALARVTIAPQAPGSFLVYEAPTTAADRVLARYRAVGGRHSFVYDIPDESRGRVRIASAATVGCVGPAPSNDRQVTSCLQRENPPIMSGPDLDPSLPPGEVLVEQDVLDQASRVGIIAYGPDAQNVTRTETVPAVGSPSLGGNMPGMLVAPDSPLAKEYGLAPSGLVEFGMLDFGTLAPRDAAQIRGMVASLAPTSQVSDTTTDSSQEQRLALSLLVALVGATLALLVQLASGVAVISGARHLRGGVAATGITLARRFGLSLRAVGPALLGVAVSGVLVAVVAPRLGYPGPASIGWFWCLPVLAQVIVLVVLGGAMLRAPSPAARM